VQYAKHVLDLHVTTTTSSKNVDWVRALGADAVVPYDVEDYRSSPDRYDIVLDTLGSKTTSDSFKVLKNRGVVVSVAGPPDRAFAAQVNAGPVLSAVMSLLGSPTHLRAHLKRARYFRFLTESSGAQLEHIAQVVNAGKVRPIVDRVYPFERAIEALEYAKQGRAKGKIVLQISA
jgi:NADPH:quinone reductase-like Zn-dependent oxidoreductase